MRRLGLAGTLSREGMLALVGVLLAIVAVTLPELGSDPWPFRPGDVQANGFLAPLVRAGGSEWDVGIARTTCFAAGLLLAAVGTLALRRRDWPAWTGVALAVLVALALMLPSTLLQVGLRDSTQPWFFTNDSTYQIELGGDLLLEGRNPYGHDYSRSGMERFYSFDGTASDAVREREVSLKHYAYFPGTAVVGAVWRLLPAPLDDYRLFVALATLAGLAAALAFRAPLGWRLAVGALIAANPIAVRSTWFGQNDAPSITLMILAFALATRGRARWAAAALAGAVLLKQFAVVAIPFLAIMLLKGEERSRGAGPASTAPPPLSGEDVLRNWDAIKADAEGGGTFGDLPETLPAATYAKKAQRRAGRVGGEDAEPPGVSESLAALEAATGRDECFQAAGELLFAAVARASEVGADPELALRAAADGYIARIQGGLSK